jgi:hypothetical protein
MVPGSRRENEGSGYGDIKVTDATAEPSRTTGPRVTCARRPLNNRASRV